MKKITSFKLIALGILMFFSSSVFAEWTLLAGNDGLNVYLDYSSISRDGNKRNYLEMWDLRQKTGTRGEMSSIGRFEFDCREETYKKIEVSLMSGPMGSGRPIFIDNIEWVNFVKYNHPPGSIADQKIKAVCSK